MPLREEDDMPLRQRTGLRQPPARQGCCHHWMIEPAMRPISVGVCRFCGEEREFSNDMSVRLKESKESEVWLQIHGLHQLITGQSSGIASSAP